MNIITLPYSFRDIQLIISPGNPPPFQIEAQVIEQDTARVLDATHPVSYPSESTEQLITQAVETPALTPGSVLVTSDSPLQFLAVVHDFDQEPSCREKWILEALRGIWRESEQRQLQSIVMPLLGTWHGHLKIERFFELLHRVVEPVPTVHLKRLWLVVPSETIPFHINKQKMNTKG